MLGDTAVAVHPEDERYAHLIGRQVDPAPAGPEIPIIADPIRRPEFGTGAVKVTPAHDPERLRDRQAPRPAAINIDPRRPARSTRTAGRTRPRPFEARKTVVAELEEQGLLARRRRTTTARRRPLRPLHTVVEPLSLRAVVRARWSRSPRRRSRRSRTGGSCFVPEQLGEDLLQLDGEHPRLVHLAPALVGAPDPGLVLRGCGHMTVAREDADACAAVRRDESARTRTCSTPGSRPALWPFSTLGWPDETADLDALLPDHRARHRLRHHLLLGRADDHDGPRVHGEVPFRDVYIHGLVRDEQGPEDVQDPGNGIDPLDVIDSTAPTRCASRWLRSPRRAATSRSAHKRFEGYRAFVNKLWNAARFVLMNLEAGRRTRLDRGALELDDRWILSGYTRDGEVKTARSRRSASTRPRRPLYEFVWSDFCDWYIEMAKPAAAERRRSAALAAPRRSRSAGERRRQDPPLRRAAETRPRPRRAGRPARGARRHAAAAAPVHARISRKSCGSGSPGTACRSSWRRSRRGIPAMEDAQAEDEIAAIVAARRRACATCAPSRASIRAKRVPLLRAPSRSRRGSDPGPPPGRRGGARPLRSDRARRPELGGRGARGARA